LKWATERRQNRGGGGKEPLFLGEKLKGKGIGNFNHPSKYRRLKKRGGEMRRREASAVSKGETGRECETDYQKRIFRGNRRLERRKWKASDDSKRMFKRELSELLQRGKGGGGQNLSKEQKRKKGKAPQFAGGRKTKGQ